MESKRFVHVLNKADLLDTGDDRIARLKNMFPSGIFASALVGDGIDNVLAHLDQLFGQSAIFITINVSPIDGAARSWLHQNAMVKSSHFDDQGYEQIFAHIDPADYNRLRSRWPSLDVKITQDI